MVGTVEVREGSVVVIGEFSPAIFTPLWLVDSQLIARDDLTTIDGGVFSRELTQFMTPWLRFTIDRRRLQIAVTEEPLIRAMDLAVGLLKFFPDHPADAIGLNQDVHVRLPSPDVEKRLGDLLAPKEIWGDFITTDGPYASGLRSLLMESVRKEPKGQDHFRIEPSVPLHAQGHSGVYFGLNRHYDLTVAGKPGSVPQAAALISNHWTESMDFGDRIRERLLGAVP